jgi:hypothetical protein
MGTRSLTFVYDENEDAVVCMYRQYDGYPAGHGSELAKFLKSGRIVNGLPFGSSEKLFNGMQCLAAQMVAEFKDGPGGIYLYAPTTNKDCGQEYEYHVYEKRIKVIGDGNNVIFTGDYDQFEYWCGYDT